MGAGAISGHTRDSETSSSTQKEQTSHFSSQSILATKSQMKMSCEMCSVNFSIFKRKKFCQECRRHFCSNCLPKPPSNSILGRQCNKCKLLMSGHFSRDDLQSWKVKDMTCFLNARNISTKDCREKHDLIELVLTQFCTQPRLSLQDQEEHQNLVKRMAAHVHNVNNSDEPTINGGEGPSTQTEPAPADSAVSDSSSVPPPVEPRERLSDGVFEITAERLEELLRESVERIREVLGRPDEASQQEEPPAAAIRRMHLNDLNTQSDIEDLSIRQLKELLVNNFVDYRGCCEKPELIERVKRLWNDHQANKAKAERLHKEDELAYYGTVSQPEQQDVKDLPMQSPEVSQLCSSENPSADTATINKNSSFKSAADASKQQVDDSLCHICMDALVDCILLECGHMVTCTQCGKRLADCPICRQYIVRVVRVFRS
ncbi:E3 ubiquitin-protein ligase rififylin [Biomphalaria pfeifferi]|uniref:E3 ubiquitin-protein ligase rififylin n=1 Tax=Biomphalaria pfeifferi TaxID=112525 RepID=A0AAD8FCW8_BIOPF|nr:E3 ubiquitin-protein ligase rififylin [Biomphalaria pfeifferi]